jgi:hypothetical protein
VLSVTAPGDDPAPALRAAAAMAAALRGHPEVAWLRVGPGETGGEAVHALYFPRRHYLLDDAAALTPAGLRAAAQALKLELSRPTGSLV